MARRYLSASRSIPAWAGEAPQDFGMSVKGQVDPRVGGGSSIVFLIGLRMVGRSPRGRGKLSEILNMDWIKGSIPAWAGEALIAK